MKIISKSKNKKSRNLSSHFLYISDFCSLTDRPTDKICVEYAHIQEESSTQKMRALSYIEAEKNMFPPKPDIHTDGWTLAFIE